jgi:hypothetical protein
VGSTGPRPRAVGVPLRPPPRRAGARSPRRRRGPRAPTVPSQNSATYCGHCHRLRWATWNDSSGNTRRTTKLAAATATPSPTNSRPLGGAAVRPGPATRARAAYASEYSSRSSTNHMGPVSSTGGRGRGPAGRRPPARRRGASPTSATATRAGPRRRGAPQTPQPRTREGGRAPTGERAGREQSRAEEEQAHREERRGQGDRPRGPRRRAGRARSSCTDW